MARTTNRKTCENPTSRGTQYAIRLQNRPRRYRCNNQNRTSNQDRTSQHQTNTNGPIKSIRLCKQNAPLYHTIQKGLPISTIKHIGQGHQNTTLRSKDNANYGPTVMNNVGLPQGSELSALLFIHIHWRRDSRLPGTERWCETSTTPHRTNTHSSTHWESS